MSRVILEITAVEKPVKYRIPDLTERQLGILIEGLYSYECDMDDSIRLLHCGGGSEAAISTVLENQKIADRLRGELVILRKSTNPKVSATHTEGDGR